MKEERTGRREGNYNNYGGPEWTRAVRIDFCGTGNVLLSVE